MNKSKKIWVAIGIFLAVFVFAIGLVNLAYENSWKKEFGDYWKFDGAVLMQHEVTGEYGCFGCNEGLCVDPVFAMKPVEETWERYCNGNFEIVE